MKRSLFFIISGVLAFIFGMMMLSWPELSSTNFFTTTSRESSLLFRSIGGMILATGVLNLLVRNDADSATLKAVLVFNIITHLLSLGNDLIGASEGIIIADAIIPGILAHVFILVGSTVYAMRMKLQI